MRTLAIECLSRMGPIGMVLSAVLLAGVMDNAYADPSRIALPTAEQEIQRPDPPGPVQRRLKQLTGTQPLSVDSGLADPSPPHQLSDGRIRVTGTSDWRETRHPASAGTSGFHAAVWSNWDAFLRGEAATLERIPLHRFHSSRSDGPLLELNHDETLWDITIEQWSGEEVLWGGAMTPPSGAEHAVMWDDNWTRRVWPFLRDSAGRWVRHSAPLFGETPTMKVTRSEGTGSYLDHSYGHQFIADDAGGLWVFYEKVSQTLDGAPWRTEIFARPMASRIRASDEEHRILGPTITLETHHGTMEVTMRSARRAGGDALVEGARPARVSLGGQTFYFLGFSAGEFRTGTYGIHFAVSRDLLGPYQPYVTEDGRDFLDLGAAIRKQYGLSWGPGRPALFQDPYGEFWLLFHATQAAGRLPAATEAAGRVPVRQIYLAPMELSVDAAGVPVITLSDHNKGGADLVRTGATATAANGVWR